LIIFLLSCAGCEITSERFLVGTYRAEAPCVTITLAVNRDHTFAQDARTKQGEANRLTGRWKIDSSQIVTFEPFLDFIEEPCGRDGNGGTGFRAERWPRGITMGPIIVKCPESSYKIDYVK
jgi:hypothetical protein